MRRRLVPALLTAVALVSLTGCIKLDADIEVHEDETVSGSMTVGMSKRAIEMMEGMAESFGGATEQDEGGLDDDFFEEGDVPEGAEVERFEDDKFIGQTMTFSDITLDELSATTAEDAEDAGAPWTLERDGDTFLFTGTADFADEEETGQAEQMGFDGLFDEADMEISVTFPGPVTEANGEIDGNTVTWRPEFGDSFDMHAEAEATSSFPVWPVAGVVAGVLVFGGLALLALRQRRARSGQGPEDGDAGPVTEPAGHHPAG